jgi:hypothetical protein
MAKPRSAYDTTENSFGIGFSPIRTLKGYMSIRGIDAYSLAANSGVDYQETRKVLAGLIPITKENAEKFSKVLNIAPENIFAIEMTPPD